MLASRLIFETFSGIELKDGDEVDHIDSDPTNNSYDNLRLVHSRRENMSNNNTKSKLKGRNTKPVIQFDVNGNFIREFDSVKSAKEYMLQIGEKTQHISSCCVGREHCHTAGGFRWAHKENCNISYNPDGKEIITLKDFKE